MKLTKLNLDDKRYMQYAAALSATLTSAAAGMVLAWPSPTLLKFESEDSPVGRVLTDEESSWIVSSYALASIIGSFIVRWGIDYFGSKKTILFSAVLLFLNWLILLFAKSLWLIITARCLGGIAIGCGIPGIIIYNAEVSEEDIRGKLGTYAIFLKTLGTVIVLVIGPFVSYTVLIVICGCGPIISFFAFVFMPESPFYHVKNNREEEAKKSLITLSKNTADKKFIENRLKFIKKVIEEDMKNKGRYIDLFTVKEYRWILFLLFVLKSLQQFSGHTAIEAYLQPIMESSHSGLDSEVASIIIGCIQFPTVYLSGIMVDKLGRKPLLIFSSILSCIALLGEGTYFLIQNQFGDVSGIGWVPITGLILFWIGNSIGILPLPYVLSGELLPMNIKGMVVSLATVYSSLASFIVSKFFKSLSNAIGMYSMFFIFAAVCVIGAILVFLFLPETKGKNFHEIQEELKKRNRKENKKLSIVDQI